MAAETGDFRHQDSHLKARQKADHNLGRRARELPALAKGDQVLVKISHEDRGKRRTIRYRAEYPDSYWVVTGGILVRRNGKHLRKLLPSVEPRWRRGRGTGARRAPSHRVLGGAAGQGGTTVNLCTLMINDHSAIRRKELERVAKVRIVGNSMVRNLGLEGIESVPLLGRKLRDMGSELSARSCYKIVMAGIPDIMSSWSAMTMGGGWC